MCLILFAHRCHSRYPLVVAANRDEFYERPSLPAGFWPDISNIDQPLLFAGKDLVHGGTWMGITRSGRFAAVTNYRETGTRSGHRSRGIMVRDFLTGDMTASQYLALIMTDKESYGGFNLLVRDNDSFRYFSNRSPDPVQVEPSVHGLSNHLLDTGWRKVAMGRRKMTEALREPDKDLSGNLYSILQDSSRAAENELPHTGFDIQWESVLSAAFITSPTYGTRSSTVILVDVEGKVTITERSYSGPDDEGVERTESFSLEQG